MIISTGKIKRGRLAGGGIPTHETKVGPQPFGKRSVYSNPVQGNRPGGLKAVQLAQHADPHSTIYGHPFDGGGYRSISTQPTIPPSTSHGVTKQYDPFKNVPEVQPNEKATFFRRKYEPIVRTVFGTNQTGPKPSTAFNKGPQAAKLLSPLPVSRSSPSTEKLQNKDKIPSFKSVNNLWGQANHSFLSDRPNTIDGRIGTGRWSVTKRSVL